MQAALLRSKRAGRRGVLYPLLVIVAISVIIFSALGAAALAGWLPGGEWMRAPERKSGQRSESMQAGSCASAVGNAGVIHPDRLNACALS